MPKVEGSPASTDRPKGTDRPSTYSVLRSGARPLTLQVHHYDFMVRQATIFALVIAIIGLFGALTVFLVNRQGAASAEVQGLYEKDYRVASLVGQIDGLLTRVDINILRMIAIGDAASIASWKAQNADRFTEAGNKLNDLKASADPSMLASIKSLEAAYGAMRKGMERQVQAIEAGDIPGGGVINKNEVKDNADRTFGLLAELKGQQDQLA